MQTKQINGYTGAKVFTATVAQKREALGDEVTRWLGANRDVEVVDTVVSQSSDSQFHCVTIVVFYRMAAIAAEAKAA
jgi:hypothetical protein